MKRAITNELIPTSLRFKASGVEAEIFNGEFHLTLKKQ